MLHQNMDVEITGPDMLSASNADREELMQLLELILEEDEIRMWIATR